MEERLRLTLAKLEAEKREKERRRALLRAAVIRREAARDTRAEVEQARSGVDPDAAVVERAQAERENRG